MENTVIEEEKNFLLTHSTTSIIELFKEKGEATNDFIKLVKSNLDEIKKLVEISNKLTNISLIKLIDETSSPTRNYRHIFVEIILKKALLLQKTDPSLYQAELSLINDSVLIPRSNDVDYSIRLLILQYFYDLPSYFPKPTSKNNSVEVDIELISEHFNLIVGRLHDKVECVRKKAIKVIYKRFLKISASKHKKSKEKISELILNDSFIERIENLIKNENVLTVKAEAIKIILTLFNNYKEITEKRFCKVMKNFHFSIKPENALMKFIQMIPSSLITTSVKSQVPDLVYNLDMMHKLLKQTNIYYLSLCKIDFDGFLKESAKYIQEKSTCCSNDYFCLFDMIIHKNSVKISNLDPLFSILDICKDNDYNIEKITLIITKISNLLEFHEEAEKLLTKVFRLGLRSFALLGEVVVKLLKSVSHDFKEFVNIQIEFLLNNYGARAQSLLVREFDIDITKLDMKSMGLIDRAYYSLWRIKSDDFVSLEKLFMEKTVLNTIEAGMGYSYKDLVEFIIYFNKKCNEFNTNLQEATTLLVDTTDKACYFILTQLLLNIDLTQFSDEESCLYLWRLIELEYFTDQVNKLFEYISPPLMETLIGESKGKSIKYLLDGILNKDILFKKDTSPTISIYGKFISKKLVRISGDKSSFSKQIYEFLKENISVIVSNNLHEKFFINFTNLFSINEAIVLEALLPEGRFKSGLLKKITSKSIKNDTEKENVIII